jgi:hypothetical protein
VVPQVESLKSTALHKARRAQLHRHDISYMSCIAGTNNRLFEQTQNYEVVSSSFSRYVRKHQTMQTFEGGGGEDIAPCIPVTINNTSDIKHCIYEQVAHIRFVGVSE